MELRMEEKVEFGLEGFWGWIEVVWIGWVFWEFSFLEYWVR